MDLFKFENKWKIAAILIWFALLILIGKSGINQSERLFILSAGLILLPISLLTIYALTKIKTSILSRYSNFRKEKEKEIKKLREKEEKEKDIKKQIEITEEILILKQTISSFQSNRLIRHIIFSLGWFLIAIFSSMMDLSKFITGIQNWTITFTLLWIGLYYSSKILIDILIALKT